jgi:hypothetical protein
MALALLLSSARSARAAPEPEVVILLEPTTASPTLRQSLSRIKDELSADKFAVLVAAPTAASEPGAVVEAPTPNAESGTIITLFGDPETGEAELCVVRRVRGRSAIRRALVVDLPERMPQVLSLRALELLRATALELSIADETPPVRPPAPSERVIEPSGASTSATTSEEASAFALDMGLALWQSIAGPPPAVAPVGRLRFRLTNWLGARLSLMGLGTRPRVETSQGSASITQNVVLFDLSTVFGPRERFRPMASVGSGLLNVGVEGVGVAPYEGRYAHQWSAALDAGLGVALALSSRAAVVTELHALVASPHPVVRIADAPVGNIGFPSLILTLALQVTP